MVVGVVSLLVTALLSLVVSRGFGALRLEWRAAQIPPTSPFRQLGRPGGIPRRPGDRRRPDCRRGLRRPEASPRACDRRRRFGRSRLRDQRARHEAARRTEMGGRSAAQLPLRERHRRLRHGVGHVDRAVPGPREMGPCHHIRLGRRLDLPDVGGRGGCVLAHPARRDRLRPAVRRRRHCRGCDPRSEEGLRPLASDDTPFGSRRGSDVPANRTSPKRPA